MLRYLLIVVVIKYFWLNPRWRKPKVEMVQNRQFIPTFADVAWCDCCPLSLLITLVATWTK